MTAQAESDEALQKKIAAAQAAIAAMAEQYIPILKGEINALKMLSAEARLRPDHCEDQVREMYGIAHNIKGQGGSFGFELITQVGAYLCDITRDPHGVKIYEIDIFDGHLEAMTTIICENMRGHGGVRGLRLLEKLRLLSEGAS